MRWPVDGGVADARGCGWRSQDPRLLCILSDKHCTACIRQVSFEHDGRAILCCCDDATIWRYDLTELIPDEKAKP